MRANAESAQEKAQNNWARNNTSLPDWYGKPVSKYKDPIFHQRICRQFSAPLGCRRSSGVENCYAGEPTARRMGAVQNEFGIPKEKVTGGKIGILYKTKRRLVLFRRECLFPPGLHRWRTVRFGGVSRRTRRYEN